MLRHELPGLEKIGQGTCFLFAWEIGAARTLRLRLVPSAPPLADEPTRR